MRCRTDYTDLNVDHRGKLKALLKERGLLHVLGGTIRNIARGIGDSDRGKRSIEPHPQGVLIDKRPFTRNQERRWVRKQ